jgi:cell division protein FtsW
MAQSINIQSSAKNWLRANLKGDIVIWVVAVLLSLFSLPLVYSATGHLAFKSGGYYPEIYLIKHTIFVLLGLVLMWAVHRINYTFFARIARLMLVVCVPFLIILTLGNKINQANRAIELVGFEFQPADLARLALIIDLAWMLARRQKIKNEDYKWRIFLLMIFWIAGISFLLTLAGNTTAMIIISVACFFMLYIGRVPNRYLLFTILFIFFSGAAGSLLIGKLQTTIVNRTDRWWNNEEPEAQKSFAAIDLGGWTGQGMGMSHLRNYIDQAYSDYAFAIIVEEYGFVGGFVIILLYIILLVRGISIVRNTKRAFGGLLAAGLTLSIVVQALIHICVSTGAIPVTGQPLPMISKGGTAILITSIALGIILSVSRGEDDESSILREIN